jgi:single-stranded-DNA-specific exonuclease
MTNSLLNFDNIVNAIKEYALAEKRVIVYADSDLDGLVSALIMAGIFRYLNPIYNDKNNLIFYFPEREKEGYGLNNNALEYLKQFSPAILFTVDCGVTNIKEIDIANDLGFECIVIDHHQILGHVPNARFVLDAHQPGETYEFKDFANAGLMVKLAKAIIEDKKIFNDLLAFGALATISDKVPVIGENKEIIDEGLEVLKDVDRLGFRTLLRNTEPDLSLMDDLILKVINPLNISINKDHVNQSFVLLDSNDPVLCEQIVKDLLESNRRKIEEKQKVINDVVGRVEKYQTFPPDFIFEGSKDWEPAPIGSACSDILKKYGRPVFLFKIYENESIGSARLPKEYNGVKALEFSKDYLITYGGHPPACGYRFKNENAQLVKESLSKYFRQNL